AWRPHGRRRQDGGEHRRPNGHTVAPPPVGRGGRMPTLRTAVHWPATRRVSVKRTGGPRSIWAPRRVREVGAQFPDRQGRVSPSQALSKTQCPEPFWLGTADGPHHRGLKYQLPARPWIRNRSAITGRRTGEELLPGTHGSS